MLGKLIKYDLKALAKILAPLWGVLLVMGLIFGISIRSNLDGIGNTMIVFSLVVIVAVIVAIFVMNVIIVIQRFWNGLLQEEGYLMFTLPVTTRSLILSKVISALIISCGTALVISLLGVEIIAISPVKLMDTVTYFGNWVIKVHAGPWIGYGAVIAVVGLLSGIYHIYAAMVGYHLGNTVTENGYVSRGVCEVDDNHQLLSITERTHIEKREDHAEFTEDDGATWASLPFDTLVSMNFFGFQPMIMNELEKGFPAFLDQAIKENPLKGEYFIPSVASDLLHDGKASLEVLVSKDQWYGVTYPEDKQSVIDALAALRENGTYKF